MDYTVFIARRLSSKVAGGFSPVIVKIATISVAMGVAVMLVSLAVLFGFKREIREKISGFAGHIQVAAFSQNQSLEPSPISIKQPFLPWPKKLGRVRSVEGFATKAGIIRTDDIIQGAILKGIGPDAKQEFIAMNLQEGKLFIPGKDSANDSVVISRSLSKLLKIKRGEALRMYFIGGNESAPRGRKFIVGGIYETGLEEFDKLLVLGDIRQIRKLNGWEDDETGGYEIYLENFDDMQQVSTNLYNYTGIDLNVTTVKDKYPQLFDWLNVQDVNVFVILVMMTLVSAIAMISVLLVLILEHTRTIGVLRAMGARKRDIRRIFLLQSLKISLKGLLWGNAIGLIMVAIQYQWRLVGLPQESYYVSYVPVWIDLTTWLVLNAATLFICTLFMVIPSYFASRIRPVEAIRFS